MTDPVRHSLRDLRDQLAEAMYDQAHENCDDEGCVGGGQPWYADLATHFLMPVIEAWIDEPPSGRDPCEVADAVAQRIHRRWEQTANRDAYVLNAMRQVARDVVVETGVESLLGSKAATLAEVERLRAELGRAINRANRNARLAAGIADERDTATDRERERIADWFATEADLWRINNSTEARCEYDHAAQMVRDLGPDGAR